MTDLVFQCCRTAMRTRIVTIGRGQGVVIPEPLLHQTGLTGEVQIQAVGDTLVIRKRKVREGWAESFTEMARRGEDLLDDDGTSLTSFDENEWEW